MKAARRAALVACGLCLALAVRADDVPELSTSRLIRHPEDWVGQTIRVRAVVEDVLGPRMFTLDEDTLMVGPDVLVLLPGQGAPALRRGQKVAVVGVMRRFVAVELKKDFPWFDRGRLREVKVAVDWNTRPVVVADSVTVEAQP